jgi:hypothetical protein
MLANCASGVNALTIRCPVSDIATARNIAVAVVVEHAREGHLDQTGYALNLSDHGRYWLAQDGPNVLSRDDAIVTQFGGSSYRFKIAKCSGAVSAFELAGWR